MLCANRYAICLQKLKDGARRLRLRPWEFIPEEVTEDYF